MSFNAHSFCAHATHNIHLNFELHSLFDGNLFTNEICFHLNFAVKQEKVIFITQVGYLRENLSVWDGDIIIA